jgi:hypothetical protein
MTNFKAILTFKPKVESEIVAQHISKNGDNI